MVEEYPRNLMELEANVSRSKLWPSSLSLITGLSGYEHQVTFLKGKKKTPSELLPRVHRVISLLKRWLMGTHQGAVSHKYLDYYLDEFNPGKPKAQSVGVT